MIKAKAHLWDESCRTLPRVIPAIICQTRFLGSPCPAAFWSRSLPHYSPKGGMVTWVVGHPWTAKIHSPCYRSVTVLADPLLVNIHAPNFRTSLPSPMKTTPEPTGYVNAPTLTFFPTPPCHGFSTHLFDCSQLSIHEHPASLPMKPAPTKLRSGTTCRVSHA